MRQLEHQHQVALFRWAKLQCAYPELDLLFAIPNGGHRSKSTAGRLKAEGVKAGVPDLFLPVQRGGYAGLWIELKAGRNKPTQDQLSWHLRLSQQGYRVSVCYGWEAARDLLLAYLGGQE